MNSDVEKWGPAHVTFPLWSLCQQLWDELIALSTNCRHCCISDSSQNQQHLAQYLALKRSSKHACWMNEWIHDLMNERFLPTYHPLCLLSKVSARFSVHPFGGYLSREEEKSRTQKSTWGSKTTFPRPPQEPEKAGALIFPPIKQKTWIWVDKFQPQGLWQQMQTFFFKLAVRKITKNQSFQVVNPKGSMQNKVIQKPPQGVTGIKHLLYANNVLLVWCALRSDQ